ncbi:MAG: glycosyltransferase, partial [Acidimicrobiia bacterium]
ENFDLEEYRNRLRGEPRLAIVEFPHRDYKAIIDGLAVSSFTIVYDLIDDWNDHTLGSWWYEQEFADWLIARADVLGASAPSLLESLSRQSGREVVEVPNGVNTRLFAGSHDLATLPDLPPGNGPVFQYHGSLYGNWFDWDAVARVADNFPDARVVLIGDRPRHPPALPENVHLLGLKAQSDLPAYLSRADVGLVPFAVSRTTHAVSPLKVFEYLAMGVPAAGPPLESIAGLEGVHTDDDLVVAVKKALEAPRPDRHKASSEHGWDERLGRILRAAGVDLPPIERPVRIERRPVRHYLEEERVVR